MGIYLKSTCLTFLFATIYTQAFSQKSFFATAECGGPVGWYSVNIGKQVGDFKYGLLSTQLGISTLHIKDFKGKFNPEIQVPICIQYNTAKKHSILIGLGTVINSQVKAIPFQSEPDRTWHLNLFAKCGYQFQKNRNSFAIFYSPLFEYDGKIRQWGGFSYARYFDVKK